MRAVRNALAALGALYLAVTFTPLVPWWARALAGQPGPSRGDTLIVLGGSILEDGTIGDSSWQRSVEAARLFHDGGFRRVLISGGGSTGTAIAVPMRDFLISRGVPAEAVRIEASSRNTRENALFTARMLGGAGSIVLLSSDYHLYRATRAFRKVGVPTTAWPVAETTTASRCLPCRWPVFLTLAGETAKIVYYWARGWI